MQGDIIISTVHVGMIGTNCYIVYKDNTESLKEAVIIDPGDDADKIYDKVEKLGVKPVAVLLTHGHFDHILAVNQVARKYNIDIYASEEEESLLGDAMLNLSGGYRRDCTVKDYIKLVDGQELELANIQFKTILTPGHTSGSMCYFIENENVLFSGDMLFRESVGRTDFPTGSEEQIIISLNNKLMKLEDKVDVYPGHGPATTIGYERVNNMFVS